MIPQRFAFTAVSPTYNREVITDAFISAPTPNNIPVQLLNVKALWDTGASNSVIKPHIVNQLGIKADGVAKSINAGGENTVNTYLVNIALPNKMLIPMVRVTECAETPSSKFDIIIGMDIISLGDLSISGQGIKRVVSFCMPSAVVIDFVQMLQPKDTQTYNRQ